VRARSRDCGGMLCHEQKYKTKAKLQKLHFHLPQLDS
jgi:hypothetical protein